MALKDIDYIDQSAFLRVQEKRLLTSAGADRAADASNLQDTLRLLSQNSDYDFTALRQPEDYEGMLKAELKRVYALAYTLAKDSSLVNVLACKYDYHNLKAALKAQFFPQRSVNPYIHVTDVDPVKLEALAAGEGKVEAPDHLVKAAREAREAFAKDQNPQSIDLSADKNMYAYMLDLCGEMENGFITGYVEQSIDFYNLKALLRIKSMQRGTAFLSECLIEGGRTPVSFFLEHYNKSPSAMVPVFYYKHFGEAMRQGVEAYEKTGNFSGLERMLDNCLIAYTRQAKYIPFGGEILFTYLLSKENEIRQIRIIMTCKANEIQPEALRERLRENYA